SQRAKFSFNKSNVTINELITFIENNSDYVFVFSDNTRQLVDTTMASFNGVFFRDSISITYYGKDSILIKNHDNKYWLENKYYYFNNVFYEE
ncbi:MAG: hypothetical protein LBE91_09160, partial [Tannerella sp.]|nr:hypothetical protein [Tannerella sp.]